MKSITSLTLVISLLCTANAQSADYIRFDIKRLLAKVAESKEDSLRFLSETTLSADFLRIGGGMHGGALESPYDQVYIVVDGAGKLQSGASTLWLDRDSILYIPRNTPHWFTATSGLDLIRILSYEDKSNPDSPLSCYSLQRVECRRSPAENVWNPFIRHPSMTFGLYMLPKPVGGDSVLVHRWDEVNLVTKGHGKFQVGGQVMDVQKGDIVYVRNGNGHYFHSLWDNLDILIFFEKRSVQPLAESKTQ